MRMILRVLPDIDKYAVCQCILYTDGYFTATEYRVDNGLSTHDGIGSWDYGFLIKFTNDWSLRKL